MFLYHSFPRQAAAQRAEELKCSWREDVHNELGLKILASVLQEGLLLAPERFEIEANPRISTSRPHVQVQVRASFTLSSLDEISEPPSRSSGGLATHSFQFGSFAIALDPLEARALGVLPTIYFYRSDPTGEAANPIVSVEQGMSFQLLYRLTEIMDVLKILARLEADNPAWTEAPTPHELKAMNLDLPNYPRITSHLEELSRSGAAKRIHDGIFNTDRVSAWSLINAVQQLLDLFQTADSQRTDVALAYFQQREWRLIATLDDPQNLGDGPMIPLSFASAETRDNVLGIPNSVLADSPFARPLKESYVSKCWLVRRFGPHHFRRAIRHIVVPKAVGTEAQRLIEELCGDCRPELIGV